MYQPHFGNIIVKLEIFTSDELKFSVKIYPTYSTLHLPCLGRRIIRDLFYAWVTMSNINEILFYFWKVQK